MSARPRWRRPSVPARIGGIVLVATFALVLSAGATVRERTATVEETGQLELLVSDLTELVRLRSAFFDEQLAVILHNEGAATVAPAALGLLMAETDTALAAIDATARPFTPDDLTAVRLTFDDPVNDSGVALFYQRESSAIEARIRPLFDAASTMAVALGDARVVDGMTTLRSAIDAYGAANQMVVDFIDYGFSHSVDLTSRRSQLARSVERLDLALGRLDRGQSLVPFEFGSQLITTAAFDRMVEDALQGVVLAPGDDRDQRSAIAEAAAEGQRRSQAVGDDVIELAEATRSAVNDRAEDARAAATVGVLAAVALMTVSVGVGLWLAWSIVRPIRRLTEQARRMSTGDLAIDPVPSSGPPELVAAVDAFNDTAATLHLLQGKAQALADADFDAPAMDAVLPGEIGAAMGQSVRVLSESIAARSRLQEDLHHAATHDSLTGITNRAGALAALDDVVAGGRDASVMFIDLDHFKQINDTHGHAIGDQVLTGVVRRLAHHVGEGEVLARLGGDEFLLIVEGAAPEARATRVLASFDQEFVAGDGTVGIRLSASIGIAVGLPGDTALALLQRADMAAYRAKGAGRGQIAFYDAALHEELVVEAELERDLVEAVATGNGFSLAFQPIVPFLPGEPVAVEALARWERPGHGTVSPGRFIEIAERSRLVIDLDRLVLRLALEHLKDFDREFGLAPGGADRHDRLRVAVNISGRHLLDDGFVDDIRTALADASVAGGRLVIEVTETVLIDDIRRATDHLLAVHAMGVVIAIDDFGTGFTSLSHLRDLPIDEVKIDRSFVSHLEGDADRRMLTVMADLARSLGLRSVAEGIETVEQQAAVRDIGCDSQQGYLLARPMPAEEVVPWMRAALRFGMNDDQVAGLWPLAPVGGTTRLPFWAGPSRVAEVPTVGDDTEGSRSRR